MLAEASDWQLQINLTQKLVFPQEEVSTTFRPGIVLKSSDKKSFVVVELTIPWEDRPDLSHELKRTKYHDLLDIARLEK